MVIGDVRSWLKSIRIYVVLYDDQNGATALISAANRNHASVVKVLLGAKADVNHANNVSH
jgi:ankyrin repeat protein